jgi:hypothetical protein
MRVVDGSWVGARIGTAVGLAARSCDCVREGTEAVRSGRLRTEDHSVLVRGGTINFT